LISNTTYRKRQQERAILEDREDRYVSDADTSRFVDFGIRLCVVVPDPNGLELVADCPPVRVAREHRFGGVVDTRLRPPRMVAPSQNPVLWYCSEDQEAVLLHDDPAKPAQLVNGSEGAGKTTVACMYHVIRGVLPHLGERREGGQTSPTLARLESLLNEMRALYPPSWFKYESSRRVLRFADGSRIRLRSTHRRSKAQGSPLQSYNWSWHVGDEEQDSTSEHDNVTARLRSAKGGAKRAPRLCTATSKDDTDWRNLRDKLLASGLWMRRTLLGTRSPFVHPDHWEAMRLSMSPREYERRVLAKDVGPERMTYPTWDREHNLIRIPDIGFGRDVTAEVLAPWGPNFGALVGHDPGTLFDVSLVLKAYGYKERPTWVVVGECTTEQTTTEQHIAELLKLARSKFGMNMIDWRGQLAAESLRMLVRADPYGNNDSKPDRSCYTLFRNAGIAIHPAAYVVGGTKPGRVPKNEGIELVCSLLCNAANERRLFIAKDELGQPLAPRLVRAIESSERDLAGKAETQRKDEQDLSHWPAALRYALWAIERPRLQLAQ